MPELPDVEIFRRYLNATCLHKKIKTVRLHDTEMLERVCNATLKKMLTGNGFACTRRHGKHLFVLMDHGSTLVLHFGMTGFLKYFKNNDSAPGHARLEIGFADGYRLVYDSQRKLGQISMADDVESFVRSKELGPDVLDERFDEDAFAECCAQTRAAVKSALMKQQYMAGIGNVYSDEILFQAGVHPGLKAAELSEKRVRKLFSAMKRVLTTAIQCKADPARLPDSYIIPRRGRGGTCPRCGSDLHSAKISGRTSWYCPRCQKKSGKD